MCVGARLLLSLGLGDIEKINPRFEGHSQSMRQITRNGRSDQEGELNTSRPSSRPQKEG